MKKRFEFTDHQTTAILAGGILFLIVIGILIGRSFIHVQDDDELEIIVHDEQGGKIIGPGQEWIPNIHWTVRAKDGSPITLDGLRFTAVPRTSARASSTPNPPDPRCEELEKRRRELFKNHPPPDRELFDSMTFEEILNQYCAVP